MPDDKRPTAMPLPLVVQLGFAGSRHLLDAIHNPSINVAQFEAEVESSLATRLRQLRQDLELEEWHFFCGISAIAIGGDLAFCKACRNNNIPVRILLPQTRDEFLVAKGSGGPDFPLQSQKDEVAQFLDSPHVIQERLVSDSPKREERFEDVNREIVRASDVLICLLRKDIQSKPGGTEDLIERAVKRNKPVLVIQVSVVDGKPSFTERWRLPERNGDLPSSPAKAFNLPKVPLSLAGLRLPDAAAGNVTPIERYATAVKHMTSDLAKTMHWRFTWMAIIIIGAHIIATVLAALALGFSGFHLQVIPYLLGLELVMLAVGIWMHKRMHQTHTSHYWAEARLLAEVCRSVLAIGDLHVYLEHLFALPFPTAVKPLLETINVLQLQSTRQNRSSWEQKRDRYVERRLTMPQNGQIDFYDRSTRRAKAFLTQLQMAFYLFWAIAFASTATEFALHSSQGRGVLQAELLIGIMGTLAIVMPVLAVGALSLAAALDMEAQVHTYQEMLEFLKRQVQNLISASSERDYARLVIETESELLGETANWFSRRSYTTVA